MLLNFLEAVLMKKIISVLLVWTLLFMPVSALAPVSEEELKVTAPYAILMEKSTGEVIYEKDAFTHVSPASVTKVMTLLLVVEEIEAGRLSLDDVVTASAHAASMGGSQIWLEEGEQMTVLEMIKCVAVVSANDCCVALAEHIAGSEAAFVARMNERARELSMNDTHFTNCTGLLEGDDHYTCAYDTAIMSRELIRHDIIKDFTTIWMDTARDGQFQLSNTNKLVYHFEGATGLKTGFTSRAMYCLAATAERDGTEYIAVIFKAPTSSDRFESAKTLLNFAFANYELMPLAPSEAIAPVLVSLGEFDSVQPVLTEDSGILIRRQDSGEIRYVVELPEFVQAPVSEGQTLGLMNVYNGDEIIASSPLVAAGDVSKLSLGRIFCGLLKTLYSGAAL